MPWQLTVDGHSMTADDMTLAECERVEKATGTDWSHLNPVTSAVHAKAIVEVLIGRFDAANAERRAADMTVKTLLDGFAVVQDDLPTEITDGIPPMGGGGATAG